MELLNIKQFCKDWKEKLSQTPNKDKLYLGIIQVGNNEASTRYVKNKVKDCEEIGVYARIFNYPEKITTKELAKEIQKIILYCTHLIIQLPLPSHLNWEYLRRLIPPTMDIDGLGVDSKYHPCTPYGIIRYLEECNFDFDGANAVVIGRSELVGKPLAKMLLEKNCTVTVCHSHTKGLRYIVNTADLVIVAVGKINFFNCSWAMNAQAIIDVGINFDENGKMVGDCFNQWWMEGKVTPVPGGVGLLTRCGLLEQMIRSVNQNDS